MCEYCGSRVHPIYTIKREQSSPDELKPHTRICHTCYYLNPTAIVAPTHSSTPASSDTSPPKRKASKKVVKEAEAS